MAVRETSMIEAAVPAAHRRPCMPAGNAEYVHVIVVTMAISFLRDHIPCVHWGMCELGWNYECQRFAQSLPGCLMPLPLCRHVRCGGLAGAARCPLGAPARAPSWPPGSRPCRLAALSNCRACAPRIFRAPSRVRCAQRRGRRTPPFQSPSPPVPHPTTFLFPARSRADAPTRPLVTGTCGVGGHLQQVASCKMWPAHGRDGGTMGYASTLLVQVVWGCGRWRQVRVERALRGGSDGDERWGHET